MKNIIPEHDRTVAHFPISILNKQLIKQHLSFQTDIIPVLLTNLSFQTDNIHVLLINLCIIFVLNWHLLKLFLSPSSCLDSITPNNHRLMRQYKYIKTQNMNPWSSL